MKHRIEHKNYLGYAEWKCTCGQMGTTQDNFLNHQLENSTEKEVKKEMTLKLYWTLQYDTCFKSNNVAGFFIYTNQEELLKDMEQIGECISQHIENKILIKHVNTQLFKCTDKDYQDWKSFWLVQREVG